MLQVSLGFALMIMRWSWSWSWLIIIGTDLQFVTLPAHVSVKNTTRDGGSTDCTHGLHRFYTVSNMPTCIALWLERSKNIAHNGKSSSRVQFLTIALLHWSWCSWLLTHGSDMHIYRVSQKKLTNRMQQTDPADGSTRKKWFMTIHGSRRIRLLHSDSHFFRTPPIFTILPTTNSWQCWF